MTQSWHEPNNPSAYVFADSVQLDPTVSAETLACVNYRAYLQWPIDLKYLECWPSFSRRIEGSLLLVCNVLSQRMLAVTVRKFWILCFLFGFNKISSLDCLPSD